MLCSKKNIDLALKIGGCEAKSDIDYSISVGVKKIVAPMIETPFAASKFESYVKDNNHQKKFILAESKTALEILKT
jgi:hypothetical protein